MKILNQKERTKSFLSFLLFFIITVVIILIAVFFTGYFPFKENDNLRAQNMKFQKEMKFQDWFSKQLEVVKNATDSINLPGENNFFNEQFALSKLSEMYQGIPQNDSVQTKELYNNVILGYKEVIDLKKQLRLYQSDNRNLDSLMQLNKEIKLQYEKVKTDLEVCRMIAKAQ